MPPEATSWLELVTGKSVPIAGTYSMGRAHSNQLVLDDEKVSRHHALIRIIDDEACWIVDLASANGTYVNGRRIDHAAMLRDRDEIILGPCRIIFRSSHIASARPDDTILMQTVHELREVTAWFLLVDIVDSTGISRQLGPHGMVKTFDEWMAGCRRVLEDNGGLIDKPLGDGFFAFWPIAERSAKAVAEAMLTFEKLQATSSLPFRMVVHCGPAFAGGQMASGIYRLFGPEVNFTFRMEGLAKALKIDCLVSEAARLSLGDHLLMSAVGTHPLEGESFQFFRL